MTTNISAGPAAPNGSMSLKGSHPKGLLDTLVAIRWDLKYALLDEVEFSGAMATHTGRLLDEISASIDALRELIDRRDMTS